ncbi:hypothetical protein [Spiroplasma endosymbiont of Lariophagus distinguendus]|uniref:hypothetical protein n=1 Tax=Spiroplasma endosymbiont of Lariophagus distinguendus TaxID=2935082 RepID=UPI00207ADE33|nr:hypothetical protein [Spiroplasma endosymbiont of Lariophagus distinguendus]
MQNQQNRLKETVLEEQTICGVTESFVKLTEQQLKKHNYANRNKITNLEIDQRLRNRFAIETKTKGTTNAGICSSDVLYDKEIKASKSKISQNIRTVYYVPPSTHSMWSPKNKLDNEMKKWKIKVIKMLEVFIEIENKIVILLVLHLNKIQYNYIKRRVKFHSSLLYLLILIIKI